MKQIFISYSRDDKWMKDFLQEFLAEFQVEVWDDSKIEIGEYWEKEIQQALNSSDAVVLVITPDFLRSEFILNQELPLIMRLKEEGQINIYPVIFKACKWQKIPKLASLQMFPTDGIPLNDRGLEGSRPLLNELAETLAKSTRNYQDYSFKTKQNGTQNEIQNDFSYKAQIVTPKPKETKKLASIRTVEESQPFPHHKVSSHLETILKDQEESLAKLKETVGADAPALAVAYNNTAAISRTMGELRQAMDYQLLDISISEKKLPPNHPDLATSYNNLALIYKEAGHLEKAMEFQLKDLRIAVAKLKKDDPDLATTYDNLSTIYQSCGKLYKALDCQEKALSIRKKVLDKHHPALATSYNNMSSICRAMGRLEDALAFQLKDVKISKIILDEDHPDLATAFNNLASIYFDMQDYQKAYLLGKRAVGILSRQFPHDHPKRTRAEKNLQVIRLCLS